jgi:glucosyl-3-phosphoglycerate synthase
MQARPRGGPFTFAVVGRDEAKTLAGVLEQAQHAALPGDRVWFVDSASRDDSATIARRLGVEVVGAPAGKGRAIAAALDRCEQGYICFIDADLFGWTTNIPATLRAAVLASGAEMVVGGYESDRRRSITPAIYWPLVDALFPDHGGPRYPRPLSGLRAIDVTVPVGPLPPGYGVETHLNLALAAAGRTVCLADLGVVRGPLRGYANVNEVATAVTAAILDFAVTHGRLDADLRPRWEGWVREVLDVIAGQPPPGAPDEDYLARLEAVGGRPLPPARKGDRSVGAAPIPGRLAPIPGRRT